MISRTTLSTAPAATTKVIEMASQEPAWHPDSVKRNWSLQFPVTEDRASRSDFLAGARAGGLLVGAVAAASILAGVQGRRGARRRQR